MPDRAEMVQLPGKEGTGGRRMYMHTSVQASGTDHRF